MKRPWCTSLDSGRGGMLIRRVAGGMVVALALLLLLARPSQARPPAQQAVELPAILPPGFTITSIADGFTKATAMALAPDGRVFVCEQDGTLRVVKNGAMLATPFLTVAVDSSVERGLLGVAFDPGFTTNGWVYVYYTATTPTTHNRVSRFTASGDVAVPGSEVIIFELDTLGPAGNHNGGALHFGPDGKLYIAVGDNTRGSQAQLITNLLGKMLRINRDGTIPSDNPYYTAAAGKYRAIWAIGLRNPFTFDIQPSTGRLFANDVGNTAYEEINDVVAGGNYGWPATEGYTSDPRYTSPVYAYPHGTTNESGCAITGGAFYNPATVRFPAEYVGDYFFTDLCVGWISRIDSSTKAVNYFGFVGYRPVGLTTAPDGSLILLTRSSHTGVIGELWRISYTGSQAPSIETHPRSQTVSAGQSVTFDVEATGALPLAYQWQRNGADVSGATSAAYTFTAALADSGAQFRVRVSNVHGSVYSDNATLTVSANQAPAPTILTPGTSATYAGGQVISFSGSATDPEDGTLGAAAFTWWVDFHHDTHAHPAVPEQSGITSGSFTVPRSGEPATNVWYRIYLRVRDSAGRTATTYRDVLPRIVSVNLVSSPPGLQLTLEGAPHSTPYTFQSVVGSTRTIGAPSPQQAGGSSYVFTSWSDGGAATHDFNTPATNTTYTATYQASAGGSRIDVYSDALGAGWLDWSWGSTINLSSPSNPYQGTRTVAMTVTSPYGALNLHAPAPLSLSAFTHVTFAIRASTAGQRFRVALVDSAYQKLPPVPLEDHGGDPVAGSWKLYSIPLSALGATGKQISGIQIQDRTGGAQPEVYVDAVAFVGAAPAPVLGIYGDGLAAGWANWSWGSTVNLGVSAPVYSGTRALSLTVTAAWGGLYLRAPGPVATEGYTHLRFAARASTSGQVYRVELRAADGRAMPALSLADYGGQPVVGSWRVYTIPLADLGGAGVTLVGVRIKDGSGGAQAALYVDAVSLGSGSAGMSGVAGGPAGAGRTETGLPADPEP